MSHFKNIGLTLVLVLFTITACSKKENTDAGVSEQPENTSANVTAAPSNPAGNEKKISAQDFDIPVYPGAEDREGGGSNIGSNQNQEMPKVKMLSQFSSDDIEKIHEFYKNELSENKPEIKQMPLPDRKLYNIVMKTADKTTNILLIENKDKSGTDIQIIQTQK